MQKVSLFLAVALPFAATAARAQDDRIVAFCDKLTECEWEPDASLCVSNAVQSDTNSRGVEDQMCTEYADLELAWMGCMAELSCDNLDGGCARQDDARNDLEWEGATACGNGDDPQPPPSDWICDPGNFNAGDGCDCGCGGADFDCGNAGCADGSCNADGCGFCHDDDGDVMECGGVPANDGPDDPSRGGPGAAAEAGTGCAATSTASPLAALALVFLVFKRRARRA